MLAGIKPSMQFAGLEVQVHRVEQPQYCLGIGRESMNFLPPPEVPTSLRAVVQQVHGQPGFDPWHQFWSPKFQQE